MDPNKILADIRGMISRLNDPNEDDHERSVAWGLAEMIEDLDDWLSTGGFLPTEWDNRNQQARINPICGVSGCKDPHPDSEEIKVPACGWIGCKDPLHWTTL